MNDSTPPPELTDLQFDLRVSPELRSEPPSPPPGSLPRGLPSEPLARSPREPVPVEVDLLRLASRSGSLQDVHQILSQYILNQAPDPVTGRLSLDLFGEAIEEAIEHHHTSVLSYLLFKRVGKPSLYVLSAINARSSAVFQVLLDYGWNINEPLDRLMPPVLGWICDDAALTEWFLDHGADPNAPCAWDMTPMSEAMGRASLDTIKMLFRRGGDIKQGHLLHHAAVRDLDDTLELVRLILDMGALINEIQYESHPKAFGERHTFALGTALHAAADEGKEDIVSYLLQRGAYPSILDTSGRTVIQTAKFSEQPGVVRILESREHV